MNAQEIRDAVDAGKQVVVADSAYKVIRDRIGQYLIVCIANGHTIGLTWNDGLTLKWCGGCHE